MKKVIIIILFSLLFISCEDKVSVDTGEGIPYVSIDAILTTLPESQTISVIRAGDYFVENSIERVSDAKVSVINSDGKVYTFNHIDNGEYVLPESEADFSDAFDYTLLVEVGSDTYTATSQLYRVPEISSITWSKEELDFPGIDVDSLIFAQFYATEPAGAGDRYWARGYRNDSLINQTSYNLAWDWAPGQADIDRADVFALPIRQVITPNGTEIGEIIEIGDKLTVKLLSINQEMVNFITVLNEQVNNAGLFATPPTNVPSNITNLNSNGEIGLGWFQVCNTSSASAIIDAPNGRVEFE